MHSEFLVPASFSMYGREWFPLLRQALKLPVVGLLQEEHRQQDGGDLRNGEGEPDGVEPQGDGKQVGHGDDEHDLADHRHDQAVEAVSEGLEHGGADDAGSGEDETDADDPEGRDADGDHVRRVVEHADQGGRHDLENRKAHQHDAHGDGHAQLDGGDDPFPLLCAVVVGDDGDHAVVQAEDRHEDEALELEVHAQHGDGRGGKHQQDLVEQEGHDRHDGLHDNGRDAHLVDLADHVEAGTESPETKLQLLVFL